MFFTCGSHDFDSHVDRDVFHARYALGGGDQRFAKSGDLALGGVTQFHVK
jgi:hypothetical protein